MKDCIVGIGVTSYKREGLLDVWRSQFRASAPNTAYALTYQYDSDGNRLGVAGVKNKCLQRLMELCPCDYFFLFDDDCFPAKEGWAEYFIDMHKRTGQHHFLYNKPGGIRQVVESKDGIDSYNNCLGCFSFLTKEVIEKVGGYNTAYQIYGYEHAEYSRRVYMAGLNTMGLYLTPQDIDKYIYSMDADGVPEGYREELKDYCDENGKLRSSIAGQDISKELAHNQYLFHRTTPKIYQPL